MSAAECRDIVSILTTDRGDSSVFTSVHNELART